MSRFWRLAAHRELRASFGRVRHGHVYQPLGLRRIACDELRVRKEPLLVPRDPADLGRVHEAPHLRVENPIDRFFPLINGVRDRRVQHTPHVALMRHYGELGAADPENDYVRMLRVRARLQGRQRDRAFLAMKVRRLLEIYDSIRSRGYRAARHWRNPVSVFEEPLPPPSPGYEPRNWEIFDGHHRAAALVALERDSVEVLVVRAIPIAPYDWTVDLAWREEWWTALGGPEVDGSFDSGRLLA